MNLKEKEDQIPKEFRQLAKDFADKGFITTSLDNLVNFRNDGKLSRGLDDQNDTFTFKLYSEIINKTSELYVLNNLPKKNVGNSNVTIPYKDVFVDYNQCLLLL